MLANIVIDVGHIILSLNSILCVGYVVIWVTIVGVNVT